MIALKNNIGSEFVERVRAFFSADSPLSKARHFEFRLEQQEIVLTVPASFDAVARELTIEAARAAGLEVPRASQRRGSPVAARG